MVIDGVEVKMFSPTQAVMDRLIAFFVENDRQCLDQALWIAESQPVDLPTVERWAKAERHEEKFRIFLNRFQMGRKKI